LLGVLQAFLAFSVNFVGYGELLAPFCAARSQDSAAVGRLHTFAETVLVMSFAVVWLECTFHCFMFYLFFAFCACAGPPAYAKVCLLRVLFMCSGTFGVQS